MWNRLSAVEKALGAALMLASAGWVAHDRLGAQTTLPARVAALEDKRVQDSTYVHARLDTLSAAIRAIRDQSVRIICFLEEQHAPTGRSCL